MGELSKRGRPVFFRPWQVRMAPVPTATVTLDPREGHFGVTLSNSKVAYGCKIDDANPRDLVYLAGLRPGMVITKINDESVSSHDDLLQVMEQSRALMKKIKITYLTEKDAVIQGKRETASICKFLFILLLVFCSFFGAVYTGVIEPKKIYKSFMPPPPPPDPNAPKTGMAGEIAARSRGLEPCQCMYSSLPDLRVVRARARGCAELARTV